MGSFALKMDILIKVEKRCIGLSIGKAMVYRFLICHSTSVHFLPLDENLLAWV